MKKILIVHDVIESLRDKPYVLIKENGLKKLTIIKNINILNDPTFLKEIRELGVQWKWMIEDWEIWNEQYFQIICANNGDRLCPVHVVSDTHPKDGYKALYQVERMITIRFSDTLFEIAKHVIDEQTGDTDSRVIETGERFDDEGLCKRYPHLSLAIKTAFSNIEIYKEQGGYLSSLYSKIL